jgi:REP element-mobilizing transposase RayT
MSLPREVIPGRFYLVTRRCSQRQLILRPDPATNEAFLYCLAVAAARCRVGVLLACVMSNHYHAVIHDRDGVYPAFLEHLHKLVARSQNALRGRWENLWSSEQTCVVRLVETDDIVRKLVYTAANPVVDHLVEKVHHWPGVNGYRALVHGQPIDVRRPRHFFREAGPLPEVATLHFALPAELGDPNPIRAALEAGVRAAEDEAAAERARTGLRVLGRRAILAQSWRDSPTTREPRRNLRPTVAARSQWARIEALLRNRAFVAAYRTARALWRAGVDACFPPGTYWLRLHARVPIDVPAT